MARSLKRVSRLAAAALAGLLAACASEPVRNPVPIELQEAAEVTFMPGVRAWGDEHSDLFHDDFVQSIETENPDLFPRAPDGAFRYSFLALSGGGDHGAFGAGFLNGWSGSGERPVFKVVTGISTGALIAPFALLGEAYDETLKKAYTTVTAGDIFDQHSLIASFWDESMADNHPLRHLVHELVSDEVIDAVGAAHREGQRLYVGTTNFDAQRPVIWNMGAIANSRHPGAYAVFRHILVASAAIPILFPPVILDVEADGRPFDEMHVDGGTVGQVFFHGAMLNWRDVLRDASGEENPADRSVLYAIIDGEVGPEPKHVRRRLMPITVRTITTLVKVSAWSALYRMHLHAEEDGYEFRFTGLPDSFEAEADAPYDPGDMARMFDIGYGMGRSGDAWRTVLPGF